jgi:hypothetical protein
MRNSVVLPEPLTPMKPTFSPSSTARLTPSNSRSLATSASTSRSSSRRRGHDVVVIEQDRERARLIQDTMDALVVEGNGASLTTLEQAGSSEPTCCWRSPARTRST